MIALILVILIGDKNAKVEDPFDRFENKPAPTLCAATPTIRAVW